MNRPPRSIPLPLINQSTGPGRVLRLKSLQEQLQGSAISQDQRAAIVRWQEQEFVLSALRLSAVSLDLDRVQDLIVSPINTEYPIDVGRSGDADAFAISCLASLRLVAETVERDGRAACLSAALLSRVLRLIATSNIRKADTGQSTAPEPDPRLPVPLKLLSQWTESSSFGELHPVEQSSVILLRLKEISRLSNVNSTSSMDASKTETDYLALAAASLPLLREYLPPLIIPADLLHRYAVALDEGLRMNTRPMVELIGDSIEQTAARLIDLLMP